MLSNTAVRDLDPYESQGNIAITCAPAVLQEVRRLSVDGLVAFAHGGLEVGGLLFGTRDGQKADIQSFVEVPCEHARGPGFLLSDGDREAFARLMEPSEGQQPLGWYRAHTRTSLTLDDGDRALFELFPGGADCIGLVLKPSHWGTAAASYYVRDQAGEILPPTPREFTIEAPKRPKRASLPVVPPPPPADAPEPTAEVAVPVTAEIEPALALPVPAPPEVPVTAEIAALPLREIEPPLQVVTPKRRLPIALGVVAALGVFALAAGWYWTRTPRNLSLQAYSIAPGQVRIQWNHNSLPALDAAKALLQIEDGGIKTSIPLDRKQLSSSSITYLQTSDHISVRLHVDRQQPDAAPAEEAIEFVGPPAPQPRSRVADAAPATQRAPALRPAAFVIEKDARTAALTTAKPEPEPVPGLTGQAEKARPKFKLPQSEKSHPVSTAAVLPPAPSSAPTTSAAVVAPPSQLTFLPKSAPVLPKPAPPTTITPAPAGPRSVRLIWAGGLSRRGVVEIDGPNASVGALTGSLTGVPAGIRVSPAEFTRDGLVVYTTDAAAHGRREPPSKANGWNSMLFQFDPVRAHELVVLEAPNRVNDYKRLVIRSDARTCPVIVIDWTAQ